MTTEGLNSSRARTSASRVSTRIERNARPPLESTRSSSSASWGESSTNRMRTSSRGMDSTFFLLPGNPVHEQPVEPHLLHGFEELVEGDGFDDVAVHPELV